MRAMTLVPRHSTICVDLVPVVEKGFSDYSGEIRSRVYPGREHTVFMKEGELARFRDLMEWKKK